MSPPYCSVVASLNTRHTKTAPAPLFMIFWAREDRLSHRPSVPARRAMLPKTKIVAMINTPPSSRSCREMGPRDWSANCGRNARKKIETLWFRGFVSLRKSRVFWKSTFCWNVSLESRMLGEESTRLFCTRHAKAASCVAFVFPKTSSTVK